MGGRGSSFKRTRYVPPVSPVIAPAPQQDSGPDQDTLNTGNVDGTQRITDPAELLNFFEQADDTAANAMLSQWRAEAIDGDGRQQDDDITRFFNYIGWTSNTPEVLTETQYQQAWQQQGQPDQMYHADRPFGGVGARQFAAQYMGNGYSFSGEQYRHYLSNGIHGNGTYFADSASGSQPYGTSQFRGFFNGNAKIVRESQLRSELATFERNHPAFSRMFNSMTGGYSHSQEDARISVFAAMKGYNVIADGYGYYTVLDRSATTVSSKTVRTYSGMKDW